MSKRFGRNQKRAMRQEISRLNVSLRSENTSNRILRRKCEEQQESLGLVERILGRHFVGLQPEERGIRNFSPDFAVPSMRSAQTQWHESHQALTHTILRLTNSKFSGILDNLRDCVHFRYVTAGGEVGYSISRDTWVTLPDDVRYEIVIREVTREMASFLARNPEIMSIGKSMEKSQ